MGDRTIILLLRGLQGTAALANIILSSLVINWYMLRTTIPSPSSFNFLIFAPAFSILSIIYLELGPRCAPPRASHPYAMLACETINTIFYFGGFIALAIFLSKIIYCSGAVCDVGRVTSVVAAAEFVSWIATTILSAKRIFKDTSRQCNQQDRSMGEVMA